FPAGPVLSGLAGHDARDLVSSGVGAGLAGTGLGRLVLPVAGTGGGPVRRRGPDRDLYPGDGHGLSGSVLVPVLGVVAGGGAFDLAGAVPRAAGGQQVREDGTADLAGVIGV